MTRRNNTRRTALTSSNNPQTERTAKRIARQQKHLEKDLLTASPYLQPSGYAAKGRSITLNNLKKLEPLTDTQADFFDAYENNDADAFVLYGSSGTGKSMLALYHALQDVLDPESVYKKLIIFRSCVASREIGHLPGLEEKFAPYILPYISICADLFGRQDAYEKLVDMGKIEFLSSSFVRGNSYHDCIMFFDEAQNTTFGEANTIITRKGNNCKLIIGGDTKQDDLVQKKNDVSGFKQVLEVIRNMESFSTFKFTSDDIVRSPFVKEWIINCERLGL